MNRMRRRPKLSSPPKKIMGYVIRYRRANRASASFIPTLNYGAAVTWQEAVVRFLLSSPPKNGVRNPHRAGDRDLPSFHTHQKNGYVIGVLVRAVLACPFIPTKKWGTQSIFHSYWMMTRLQSPPKKWGTRSRELDEDLHIHLQSPPKKWGAQSGFPSAPRSASLSPPPKNGVRNPLPFFLRSRSSFNPHPKNGARDLRAALSDDPDSFNPHPKNGARDPIAYNSRK